MSIVSSDFIYVRPQANGEVRFREVHTDSNGGRHYFSGYAADLAAAEAIRDSAARSTQLVGLLKQIERDELWAHVGAGAVPATFVHTDLTAATGRRWLVRKFANTQREPAWEIAWWVDGLTQTQIETISGLASAPAARIKARAANLLSAKNIDDTDVTEDVDPDD